MLQRVRKFLPRRFVVADASMEPTLRDGQGLIGLRLQPARVGQIRCVEHPDRPGFWLVKRVTAVDGDQMIVESDNRSIATIDSTTFGPVSAAGSYRVLIRIPTAGCDAPEQGRHTIGAMAIYLCHEQPDLHDHDATVVDARPGAIALSRTAFHPGGGGQVSDIGSIEFAGGTSAVTHIDVDGETWWHVLDDVDLEVSGDVRVRIDADHRLRVASMHTMSHVLNTFVFDEFAGSLVTGAQINGDGTGRMDFDLTDIDNDRLRALEGPVNEIIAKGLAVEAIYVDAAEAAATPGLVRSLSVAPPPTPDGRLRLIDVDGLDRQACGGTHLSNTSQSRSFKIGKIENKGRRNRRIRFSLV